jgi:hypothetical protein
LWDQSKDSLILQEYLYIKTMFSHIHINSIIKSIFNLLLFISISGYCAQIDTLEIYLTDNPPVIDGNDDDYCWQITEWNPIDEVWIEWGTEMAENDFKGAYKVVWSESENLLYFLVRTVDDILVDSYIPGITADNYNFDILELFIDEDHSKGRHLFDDELTGENAENAFAYHIHARFPKNGEVTDSFRVQDIAGTGWDNRLDPVYNDNFGNFKLKLIDNVAYWEFSLKVYNDSYNITEPESSRVTLSNGQIMGLSLAYCDNDDKDEEPATRDNFIGSVWVPEKAYNDHYEDAEYFGIARLVKETATPAILSEYYTERLKVFPNPVVDGVLYIHFKDDNQTNVATIVEIFSMDGKLLHTINGIQKGQKVSPVDLSFLTEGSYIIHVVNKEIQFHELIQVLK